MARFSHLGKFYRVAIILVLGFTACAAKAEEAVLLAKNVIDREKIYLGDIWGGLPDKQAAEFAAPAPNIGSRRVFSAQELNAIAQAHKVKWQATSQNDRIIIERTRLLVTIPVTLRPMARGEIIQATDIGFMRVKSEQLNGNIVSRTENLLGKSTKRNIGAAAMVNINDIELPKMVLRNAPVTARLRTATIYLTLHAKALEDGAMGDRIKVQNLVSKQIIVGVVRGPGMVDVEMP